MHDLYTILVNIKDLEKRIGRAPTKDDIRYFAEDITEEHYGILFDYRETDTAGAWEDLYPDNVILGSDNSDRVTEELVKLDQQRKNIIKYNASQIFGKLHTSAITMEHIEAMAKDKHGEVSLHLRYLGEILNGKCTTEVGFWDTTMYSSFVDLERYLPNIEDYALVYFDYHN